MSIIFKIGNSSHIPLINIEFNDDINLCDDNEIICLGCNLLPSIYNSYDYRENFDYFGFCSYGGRGWTVGSIKSPALDVIVNAIGEGDRGGSGIGDEHHLFFGDG